MAHQYHVFTVRADGLSGVRARQYEASVIGMLRALDSLKTGRALLNGFRTVKREVLIFPYDGKLGHCNAYATNDWGMYRNKVSFSPMGWTASSGCGGHGAGNNALEILFHELVHALRFASKTLQKSATSGQEEEIAILLTNIYSSETNRPLRWRHQGFAQLPNSNPVDFYGRNLPLIKMFVREHPVVSREFSYVWTKFNPLREYYDREV